MDQIDYVSYLVSLLSDDQYGKVLHYIFKFLSQRHYTDFICRHPAVAFEVVNDVANDEVNDVAPNLENTANESFL